VGTLPARDVQRDRGTVVARTPELPGAQRVDHRRQELLEALGGLRERRRDAERTKSELLAVATEEFARRGLSGARVDEIAARTCTTKRMIYYYYSGKEQLYTPSWRRPTARSGPPSRMSTSRTSIPSRPSAGSPS
jgi:hypothetical protein